MKLRDFLMGLILTSVGILLVLLLSWDAVNPIEDVITATRVKWLGVGLMIAGPLVCWELIPLFYRKERKLKTTNVLE